MPIDILMPALSPTMTEGNLVKWIKKEGDSVVSGDILCEIETDKATMEVEAADEGILGKIIIPEGAESVAVNTLIAVLLEDGEDVSSISLSKKEAMPLKIETKEENITVESVPKVVELAIAQQTHDRIFASPLAKRIALDSNIDLNLLKGTGPHGRIIKSDVLSSKNQSTSFISENSYEDVKLTLMRKTVARRLTESKNTVPHFYLNVDCELDALLEIRKQINSQEGVKVSVNDLLIKICAKTLQSVPHANVTWHESFLRFHKSVDISVAVAIDGGLITPIIFGAEKLSVTDISDRAKTLVKKARDGKLQPQEYEGGSFTLSNLGMYGIKNFNAIINPPQGCILAVGAGEKRVVVKDNKPEIATVMTVTLSVDHRSVDGALGAEFLKKFKHFVENPILTFI